MKITLGRLRYGDIFTKDGKKYKSGDLLFNKNDDSDCVVSCENIETGETEHFELETVVSVE